jgi:hypothetical protein
VLCLLLIGAASGAAGADDGANGDATAEELPTMPVWTETLRIEREKPEQPKHPTLRFLRENRDFFRGRLDELLLTLERERSGEAAPLDPRWLMYRDMLADIRAARDSAEVSTEWIRRRELLESVGELVELETEMDEMETLLAEQRGRLVRLEEDFTGRQTTALVVLLSGVPAGGAPDAVVIGDDDGATVRVTLDDATRTALANGGAAQLLHEYVEPRDLVLEIAFEGTAWTGHPPFEVAVAPARDRLTFLELDAAGVDPAAPGQPLAARAWTR